MSYGAVEPGTWDAEWVMVFADEENPGETWWDAAREEVSGAPESCRTWIESASYDRLYLSPRDAKALLKWAQTLPGWGVGASFARYPVLFRPAKTTSVHVTEIRNRTDVWGHTTDHCDDGGCAGGADVYWSRVLPDDVERGSVYEIADDGAVLSEVKP